MVKYRRVLIEAVMCPAEEQETWQKVMCFKFSIILFITPQLKIYVYVKQFIEVYPVASFI